MKGGQTEADALSSGSCSWRDDGYLYVRRIEIVVFDD